MPGLLDNPLVALGSGLLQAAGPSRDPTRSSLGYGLGQGIAQMQASRDRQSQAQMQQLRMQQVRAQMAESQRRAAAQQQAQRQAEEQAAAAQAALPGLLASLPPERQAAAQFAAATGDYGGLLKMAEPTVPGKPDAFTSKLAAMGYTPGTPEFETAARRLGFKPGVSVNVGTGPKLSSGYMWSDPNDPSKGVTAIPGGERDPEGILALEAAKVGAKERAKMAAAREDLPQALEDYRRLATEASVTGAGPKADLADSARDHLATQVAIIESRGAEPNPNKMEQVRARIPDYAGLIDRPRFGPKMDLFERQALGGPNAGSVKVSPASGQGAPRRRTATPATAPPPAPAIGEVKKGFTFKGGDPADPANWAPAARPSILGVRG